MYTLKVEGMSCGGCTRGIENAIKKLDQQSELKFDLKQKTVQIKSGLAEADISSAITAQGFEILDIKKD